MAVPASRATQPALSASAELTGADGQTIAFALRSMRLGRSGEHSPRNTPPRSARCPPSRSVASRSNMLAVTRPGFGSATDRTRYHHGHIIARAWATLVALCGNVGKPYAGIIIWTVRRSP